jgi:hypothetical protein
MMANARHSLSCLESLLVICVFTACRGAAPAQDSEYARAVSDTGKTVRNLQERILAGPEHPLPEWALGPFSQGFVDGRKMEFRIRPEWTDPARVKGWQPRAFWNPALIEGNGRLYMFYRTGPDLEGLDSRIALAWSDDGGVTWQDYEENPIIYPTEPWESRSVEDPRIYRFAGKYYLYYIAAQDRDGGGVYADIALATSDDLRRWTKQGRIMSRDVSKGWAKSPVIPRSPQGDAVKVDGQFLMYVSERPFASARDVEEQMIGRSTDLIHWTFEQKAFLAPDEQIDSIFELATLTTGFPDSDDIVGDAFYLDPKKEMRCGQVLYRQKEPTRRLAFTDYGVCSWGGKIVYDGRWVYAQGWLEKDAIQLYTAPQRRRRPAEAGR